jgi:hypothetical protein
MFLQVVEKIPTFWKSNVDFIKPSALFTISWKNVFIARPGTIKDFNVYMSSFPKGKYFHKREEITIAGKNVTASIPCD